ncbi:MAG: Nramp family divalent metal transporter [Candidatus Andersenbacteria bacterium]|nr:Nramp family divalent metal transporter [bacterium]MDZ4225488.1 Nramp family divalent metal transporter [Candidatus Andersenbacteria bacterium]
MPHQTLPLGQKNLPRPLSLRRLIGPSFIILGLGLGSGEIILWPYLTSNYGLGIVWGILVGITMQFFINMEVERYALINGESIFVGFARLLKFLPFWFILSTFFGFGWPGIGLAGAHLIGNAVGVTNYNLVGIILFIAIGLILTLGKVLYQTVERLEIILIGVGVPFILILTWYLAESADFAALAQGLIGRGEGFHFLPTGIILGTFLAALAYSGAGGNLNLSQSFYVRDKGYGMGKYANRITSLFTDRVDSKKISLTGNTFPLTKNNLANYRRWWRVINLEHFLVFWCLGLITMLTLSLLAYITVHGLTGNTESINFVINEAAVIGQKTLPLIGVLFLVLTGIMLTATQLSVLDSTSRIITENILLASNKLVTNVPRVYYWVLWVQIIFGIAVFTIGFDEPRVLIILSAIINAGTMFVYTGLLLWLNNSLLKKPLRPRFWRNTALVATFLFFGVLVSMVLFR